MTTRLVLVGMVAALGISVPTRPDVQGWVNAIHAWTVHRLADWDASTRCKLEGITLSPMVRTRPRFEPILPEERLSDPAIELNRVAEVVDIAPVPVVVRGDLKRAGTSGPAVEPWAGELMAIATSRGPETTGLAVLLKFAERPDLIVHATAEPLSIRRSAPGGAKWNCVFTRSNATGDPAVLAPRFDPIEPLADRRSDIAEELNRFGEHFELAPSADTTPVASNHRWEPIQPDQTYETDLASALNHAADGMAVAWETDETSKPTHTARATASRPNPTSAERLSSSGPATDLADALRLTGQAAHAWMRIMTGPAVLQVSAR